MIPYNHVASILWDKQAGAQLKKLRNGQRYSRAYLSRLAGKRLSETYIQKLEEGRAKTVRREKLEILLSLLNSDIQAIFPNAEKKFP